MSDIELLVVGLIAGVGLTFSAAYAVDTWRSWRSRARVAKELRERPKVSLWIDRFEIDHLEDYWIARAYGRQGTRTEWNTGEHPMDAMRYLLEEVGTTS